MRAFANSALNKLIICLVVMVACGVVGAVLGFVTTVIVEAFAFRTAFAFYFFAGLSAVAMFVALKAHQATTADAEFAKPHPPKAAREPAELPRPVPPEMVDDYFELRHPLWFIEGVFVIFAVTTSSCLLIISEPWLWDYLWLVPILVVGGIFASVRHWKAWRIRPNEARREENALRIHQKGNLLWLLKNSEPDPYPLKQANLISPGQTALEQILEQFFGSSSQTILLPAQKYVRGELVQYLKPLRRVKDVERILAIQKYRAAWDLYLQELAAYESQRTRIVLEDKEKRSDAQ